MLKTKRLVLRAIEDADREKMIDLLTNAQIKQTYMIPDFKTNLFQMGYKQVITGAFEENIASRRVMEKCGMILTESEEKIEYRGKVHRCVYYLIRK